MQRFKVYTLFDITETRQNRKEPGREFAWQQQQNFIMLLQTIGMRTNPLYDEAPTVKEDNLKNYQFGSAFKGTHKVWSWEFYIEYDGGFTDTAGNPTGLLVDDLHFVPMIVGLDETVDVKLAMLNSNSSEHRNILVYAE
jgi:hypothetical protein